MIKLQKYPCACIAPLQAHKARKPLRMGEEWSNATIRGKPLSDLWGETTQSDSIERKKVQNVQKRLRTNAVMAYHASALTVPLSGRVWIDVGAQVTSVLENNVSNQHFIG